MKEDILDAIKGANKLGAQKVEVVDYIEPLDATSNGRFILVTRWGQTHNADELAWWQKDVA